jgi:prevent-host-death family protein
MEVTSISNLKARLSLFLDNIKNGEEVIITDRGKIFAKIIPIDSGDPHISTHLREMERVRLAHIGRGNLPDNFWTIPRPKVTGNKGVEAVLAEREDSI